MPQIMNTDMFTTLAEARDWLEAVVKENNAGAMCPCCNRFDKVYNYCLPRSAIVAIADMCQKVAAQPDIVIRFNEFANTTNRGCSKLKHLDLIYQPEKEQYTGGKTGGTWAITQKGIDFVQGIAAIPTHLIIYHDELVGVSDSVKFIHEFWPEFNYRELMSA